MASGKFEFTLSGTGEAGYLSFPDHPGDAVPGIVAKQVRLIEICGDYEGPDVYLDFDKDNRLLGIEVVS